MVRPPCCDKNGLKKGPWTPEEDQKLVEYIHNNGYGHWRTLPKNAGLQRCGKSCRLRWTNYLRPDIKRGRFSFEEEESIIQFHSILGNKWSAIAARLPGRTDNEIKNYWNTHIRKRMLRMGIDPVTHHPRLDLLDLSSILANPNPNLLCLAASLFRSTTAFHRHHQEIQLPNNQIHQNPIPQIFSNHQTSDDQQPQDYVPAPSNDYNYHYNNVNGSEQQPFTDSTSIIFNYSTDNNFGALATPLTSSSTATTYVNGSGTEDEREIISYNDCNNYKFQIPEILDNVSDFSASFSNF